MTEQEDNMSKLAQALDAKEMVQGIMRLRPSLETAMVLDVDHTLQLGVFSLGCDTVEDSEIQSGRTTINPQVFDFLVDVSEPPPDEIGAEWVLKVAGEYLAMAIEQELWAADTERSPLPPYWGCDTGIGFGGGRMRGFDGWVALAYEMTPCLRYKERADSVEVLQRLTVELPDGAKPSNYQIYTPPTEDYRLTSVSGVPVVYVEPLAATILGAVSILARKHGLAFGVRDTFRAYCHPHQDKEGYNLHISCEIGPAWFPHDIWMCVGSGGCK